MKRKHKIIAFIFSILALVLSIAMYKTSMENRKIHKMEKEFMIEIINDLEEELKEKESEENELTTDIIEDNNIISENNSSSNDNTSKNNMEINNAPNTNVVKENKTNKIDNTTTPKPKEEKKTEQSNAQPVQEQPTKPKEKTAWEELGISEHDYYHKPMWSWVTVTYSLEKYGSEEETKKNCQDDCNKSGKTCRCIIVNSYSGDYLGEYLKIYD